MFTLQCFFTECDFGGLFHRMSTYKKLPANTRRQSRYEEARERVGLKPAIIVSGPGFFKVIDDSNIITQVKQLLDNMQDEEARAIIFSYAVSGLPTIELSRIREACLAQGGGLNINTQFI